MPEGVIREAINNTGTFIDPTVQPSAVNFDDVSREQHHHCIINI
jgi:hypothetical protein